MASSVSSRRARGRRYHITPHVVGDQRVARADGQRPCAIAVGDSGEKPISTKASGNSATISNRCGFEHGRSVTIRRPGVPGGSSFNRSPRPDAAAAAGTAMTRSARRGAVSASTSGAKPLMARLARLREHKSPTPRRKRNRPVGRTPCPVMAVKHRAETQQASTLVSSAPSRCALITGQHRAADDKQCGRHRTPAIRPRTAARTALAFRKTCGCCDAPATKAADRADW